MLVFTDNIRSLVIWSLAAGGVLCLVYDIIRASRDLFGVSASVSEMKKGRLFALKMICLILGDFLFCVFAAICFLIVSFCTNGGVFRGLILICGALGFALIRFTVSKIFMLLLLKVVFAIRKLLGFMYSVLRAIALKIAKPFFSLYHLTLGRIICIIKGRIKEKRELKMALKAQLAGKEEDAILEKAQGDRNKKERIVIGRRAEKL